MFAGRVSRPLYFYGIYVYKLPMAFPRISDQPTLIAAIQTLRQFQSLPEGPDFATREKWLSNLANVLENPESQWVETIATELEMSVETVRNVEFLGSAKQIRALQLKSSNGLARGLISMISPRVFPLRLTIERLAYALLAGNVVLIKISSKTPKCADVLSEILAKAEVPDKAVAISCANRSTLQPLFTGHPAIKGVSFVGQHSTASEISKAMDHVRSRFQAWTGGISAMLIMDESFLDQAAIVLKAEAKTWPYRSPMFPTKIFVLDKFADKTRSVFSTGFESIKDPGEKFSGTLTAMKQETARVLREEAPAVVENLPNCSEYQQNELTVPIIQITSVKYTHEMAKWMNNGFLGFRAVIFGEQEKAHKLAQKLEVGCVSINKGFDPAQAMLFGVKESSIGETDMASFFYQRRQISD